LRQVGVPVPQGCAAATVEEACAAAGALGYPVVVKPRDANHGRGISFGVRNEQEVREAFALAVRENHTPSGGAIIEQFAQGVAHRVLVVGDRVVAAARGQHDTVEGDGTRTIAALVEAANNDPLRGEKHRLGSKQKQSGGEPAPAFQGKGCPEIALELSTTHGAGPSSCPEHIHRTINAAW
jgi:cyanophycin synthetase